MRERDYEMEGNNAVMEKLIKYFRKGGWSCWWCPPHRGENEGRRPKHGARKPKYKDKRRIKDE